MNKRVNPYNLHSLKTAIRYLIIFLLFLPGLATAEKKIKLHVWGFPEQESFRGVHEAVKEFERRHPHIQVIMGTPGGQAGIDPQKLMTAIAGGTPPNLIWQDRFTISGWAARGAFRDLNDLVERDNINKEDFYPACWEEACYEGKLYGLPWDTDCRGLYYNRELFRKFGLDPDKPPRDWDELVEYAKKLTILKEKGYYEQVGFAPNFGNAWLYLYGWLNGGEFMSPDGRKVTLNDPRIVEALQFMCDTYDAIGGFTRVVGFERSSGMGGIVDPFIIGKVAMVINGNWSLDDIVRYKPDLDFGVVPPPPPKGKKSLTWSGGFALVIPKGATYVNETWELAKWLVFEEGRLYEGQKQLEFNRSVGKEYYIPRMTANRKVNQILFEKYPGPNKNIQEALKTFLSMMETSRYRPVTPVGAMLWDEHVRAMTEALLKQKTPAQALNDANRRVQAELDRYWNPPQYPLLNWNLVILIAVVLFGSILFYIITRLVRFFRSTRLYRSEATAGLLFATPWFLGFLIFMLGPMFVSLVFCFCEYDVLHPAKFVGLENFKKMFGFISVAGDETRGILPADPYFWKSLWNTFYITIIGVPLGLVLGLAIAMLLNTEIRGISIYRTCFYLPSIVPIVATAILWMWLLNPQIGWVSAFLRWLGIESPNWFDDARWAKPALILMLLWGSGSSMIIWLAGLKGIPRHYYEAAAIDGCNSFQAFLNVTLPLLTPYIFFNLIMGIIGYLQIFTQAFVVSSPPTAGPGDSLLFLVFYLFNNAFSYFKMGYASALAWILFVITLFLTLIQIKLAPRWVYYEGAEDGAGR